MSSTQRVSVSWGLTLRCVTRDKGRSMFGVELPGTSVSSLYRKPSRSVDTQHTLQSKPSLDNIPRVFVALIAADNLRGQQTTDNNG